MNELIGTICGALKYTEGLYRPITSLENPFNEEQALHPPRRYNSELTRNAPKIIVQHKSNNFALSDACSHVCLCSKF